MSSFFDELEAQLRAAAERQTATRRPSWWRRRRNLGLAAVAAVGLATPAVARVSGLWDPGVPPSPSVTSTTPAISSSPSPTCHELPAPAARRVGFDPALLRLLGVLRRPPGPKDVFPVPGRFRVSHQTLVPDSVRFLGTVGEHRYFVLVVLSRDGGSGCPIPRTPVKAMMCVLNDNGSGGCGESPESLRRGGLQSGSNHGGNAEFVSLVPDGVEAVSVRYGSSTRTFRVRNNFYGYEIAADPTQSPDEVTWHLHDGREQRFKGVPHP